MQALTEPAANPADPAIAHLGARIEQVVGEDVHIEAAKAAADPRVEAGLRGDGP